MKFSTAAAALGLASIVAAQSATSSQSLATSGTRAVSSQVASATGSVQPCALASSYLAQQTGAPYILLAAIANACQRSAPFVKQDALRLIDGISPALNFQSDLGILKNPPASYPLAGADLLGDLANLRSQANSGAFTNEIDFERNLTNVLGKPQDGHLNFQLDGMSVFQYQRWIPGLVSVSMDGTSLPSLYFYSDVVNYAAGGGSMPSPVVQINGQNASTVLSQLGQNVSYGGFQDPDALYNNELWALNSGAGNQYTPGAFVGGFAYPGDNTTVTFANSTTINQANYAVFNSAVWSFKGLTTGTAYYNMYCNATAKALAQGDDINDFSSTKSKRSLDAKHDQIKRHFEKRSENIEKRQASSSTRAATSRQSIVSTATSAPAQTATKLAGYPSPVALSDDLSLSGYFLDQSGFTDTAVLVAQQMSEEDPAGFQSTLTKFMNLCRSQNKKQLIIDIQGNPGGSVALGYEIFKQLFPNIFPYGAGTLRAFEGLNTLGTLYTNYTSQLAQQTTNASLLQQNGYYTQFAAEGWANASGQLYSSWPQLYGPVKTSKENYTNLIRPDYNDTNYDLQTSNIVISGYGNNTKVAASPFTADNIIILSDGRCSSTCTIMSHLLKWQGKVKSVAFGGRPSNGAMQAIGGIKGSQVYQYALLSYWIDNAAYVADSLKYTDQLRAIQNSPTLGPILNDSAYVTYRGAGATTDSGGLEDFTFNFQNNIAEGDTTYTPLQFVYEAADCRLWFQPQHYYDIRTQWYLTASQAFGLNNTQKFSMCVSGSTNAASSLSGNSTLYNNGTATNVTSFPAGASSSGSGNNNGASQLAVSSVAALVGFAALLLAL